VSVNTTMLQSHYTTHVCSFPSIRFRYKLWVALYYRTNHISKLLHNSNIIPSLFTLTGEWR